jgi:hypothetical protein
MKTTFTTLLLFAFIFSNAQTTQTFSYTGAVQLFVVPACVNEITIDVSGAQGGSNGPTAGGLGGRVQGIFAVTAGDTFYVYVGGAGISSLSMPTGGFNGGGGVYSYSICGTAGTGGGASDLRMNDTNLTSRIAVGGGGGGAGGYVAGNQTYAGGDGGTLIAYDGVPWPGWPNSAGKGGTQIAGGLQGIACCGCPQYTTDGTLGTGGFGSGDCAGGGGGGGGYYGGGGSCFGGGGGGSNYATSSITSLTHTAGYQTGDGLITITYTSSVALPAAAGPISGPLTVCAGSSASFSVSSVANATTYTWNVPSGAVITSGQNSTSVNITFGSTTGNISVTPGNSCGTSDSSSVTVTVNPNPVVNLGADTVQCGGTVLLNAQNTGSSYLWNTSATTQTVNVSASGTYSVVVTDANNCSGTDSVSVIIHALPSVALSLNPDFVCINWAAYQLAGGAPAGGTYSGPGVNAGMFNPGSAGAGSWTITYSYTDPNNCTASSQDTVHVDLCFGIDGVNAMEYIVLSPNPATSEIRILNEELRIKSVEVYNVFGKKIFSQQLTANTQKQITVDVSRLPSGIYVMKAKGEKSEIVSKFIKQ